MSFRVLSFEEIDEQRYQEFFALEHFTWPKEDPSFLPEEYVRSLYPNDKEGIFLAIDEDTNQLAGYLNVTFTNEESFQAYLESGDFTKLSSIPKEKEKNLILYLYTANLYPQYRGTSCMREIGIAFAKWLDKLIKEGYQIQDVYCEAVSLDGARTIQKGFEMTQMDGTEDGLGHYENHDGLASYRKKMLG